MSAPQTHLAQPLAVPGASASLRAVVLTLPPSVQSIAACSWLLPLPPQPCCQPASCPALLPPAAQSSPVCRDPAPRLKPEGSSGVSPGCSPGRTQLNVCPMAQELGASPWGHDSHRSRLTSWAWPSSPGGGEGSPRRGPARGAQGTETSLTHHVHVPSLVFGGQRRDEL